MARPNFDEIALITRDLNYAYLQGYKRLISRDELLNLKGGGDLKLYETVAQDDQVKSCVQQRISAVISRDWGVEPGGEGKRDKQAAEFVEAELKNLQWDRICEKMLWGTFYGYSVGEIMWRRGDLIGIEDIKVRNRRRFNFGVDLEPKLITIEEPMGEDLPAQKFWHFCCGGDNDDDPYGRGLAHWLYWPTFFKRSDMRWWVTFLEKYAQPSRLGKYQPGATENDKETLWQAMDAFGSNGKMLIPEGTAIELLEASRAGGADYQGLLDICNSAISKIILSQTMTTDNGSSQSQANVHQDVKDDVVKADADLVCSSFNEGPIKWLTDWNFPGAAYPRVWRQMDSEPDLMAEAERDSKLQGLGISLKPDAIAGKYGEDYFVPERENPPLAGEQVTALISIVTGATQGGWSPELVKGLIGSSFPTMSDDAIAAITDNLGGDKSGDAGAGDGKPADLDSVAAQFAAAKGKKKNCKAGISCGNACISASKICRKDLTDGQKELKVPIVASAGVEANVPIVVAASVEAKAENEEPEIPAAGGTGNSRVELRLLAMANGVNPDEIKISAEKIAESKSKFMDKPEDSWTLNKIEWMQKESPNISPDEALGLSTWIGSKYARMNQVLYAGISDEPVEVADLLAAKALYKLAPCTAEQIAKDAKKKGEKFDRKKPLGRYMTVSNPEEFVKRYQEALDGDGLIREPTFFATSHIPRDEFMFCKPSTNITYEVMAKLDGTGAGRYIDHFKNKMSEGEVLYPPQSKFKVVAVIAPKFSNGKEGSKYKFSPQEEQELTNYEHLNSSSKQAFKMSDNMFGPEYQVELAKAYQAATGKPLPSTKMQKDILVKAAAIHKNISEHNIKQAGLNSGVNRDTNWVIQLQEI